MATPSASSTRRNGGWWRLENLRQPSVAEALVEAVQGSSSRDRHEHGRWRHEEARARPAARTAS